MTTPISLQAIHHVRLTVTDVARAQEFYTRILGFQVARQVPHGVLMTQGTFLLGLTAPYDPASAPDNDRFSEHRAGLDHLSFTVASRADLEQAVTFLTPKVFLMARSTTSGRSMCWPSATPTTSSWN